MSIFSYHIVQTNSLKAFKTLFFPSKISNVSGLIHSECMSTMVLGSSIFSISRVFNTQIVLFAQWENEEAISSFLEIHPLGKLLATGWHTRLILIRQWGKITEFEINQQDFHKTSAESTIVAITLARMKICQIPRFIKWGKPVEKLVRDHNGSILSFASMRFPRTISTFSIWKSEKEMSEMVHGNSNIQNPKRHSEAMKERNRKDFHIEFTTLRFKSIYESGGINEKFNIIPILEKA